MSSCKEVQLRLASRLIIFQDIRRAPSSLPAQSFLPSSPGNLSCDSLNRNDTGPTSNWGFPKIRGTLLGVPIIRITAFWVYIGVPHFGKVPIQEILILNSFLGDYGNLI